MAQNNDTPRWVKVAMGIGLLVLVTVVVLHLTVGGLGAHMHEP